MITLLEDKGQIIFYGPPGTGKTFIAQHLAEYIAGSPERVEVIQFHPAYTYEDFVEGYRPTLGAEGQATFELKPGPLKRIADKALEASREGRPPSERYVLLIDELNRGNLAKVLGELFYALEYRDKPVTMQYAVQGQQFTMPSKERLVIIATMNTADRSIALIDMALRRRFHFYSLFPDEPPIQGLLHRWLENNYPAMLWVGDVVDEANRMLGDRNAHIGPSHFMRHPLDEEWVKRIWKGSVRPYLEELFFGDSDRVKDFDLTKLRAKVTRD